MTLRNNVPAVYGLSDFARDGGLLSYGFDPMDTFRRAAAYVDRILRGAKPAELPVQLPVKFEMDLKLATDRAKAIGSSARWPFAHSRSGFFIRTHFFWPRIGARQSSVLMACSAMFRPRRATIPVPRWQSRGTPFAGGPPLGFTPTSGPLQTDGRKEVPLLVDYKRPPWAVPVD
jgi:hypothetical protein